MRKSKIIREAGFTLLELIIAIAIAIILATVAVPSFNSTIKNSKLTSSARSLIAEFEFARSEAVKRNVPVTICASTNATACNTDDWESGRIVFVDDGAGDDTKAGNGTVDTVGANVETTLKVFGASSAGVDIRSTVFGDSGHLVFDGDGSVETVGTMIVCDDRGASDRTVIKAVNLSIIGQSRLAYDSDETPDRIVNNISGANVTCS